MVDAAGWCGTSFSGATLSALRMILATNSVTGHMGDDAALRSRLAVASPCFHQLAPLLQSVAAAISLFALSPMTCAPGAI